MNIRSDRGVRVLQVGAAAHKSNPAGQALHRLRHRDPGEQVTAAGAPGKQD